MDINNLFKAIEAMPATQRAQLAEKVGLLPPITWVFRFFMHPAETQARYHQVKAIDYDSAVRAFQTQYPNAERWTCHTP